MEEAQLAAVDTIESIGEPGNLRPATPVEPVDGGQVMAAFTYFKTRALAVPAHTPLLEDYQDRSFVPPRERRAP